MKKIESIQNPFIRNLLKLQEKSRSRKKEGLFIVEGQRELELISQSNYQITHILFVKDMCDLKNNKFIKKNDVTFVEITKEVYHKLAYRRTTEGIMALVRTKDLTLDKVVLKTKTPLILVLEGLEKPGNIGAILRTADAANVDAVLIADPKTDMYNPNIIRSSVGCLFTNQIAVGTSNEIINFLIHNNIVIYSATLQNSNIYHLEDYKKASAIVVGTEATGLSKVWRNRASQNINIPMNGSIDSMNVSVATAIITFEAVRQRNSN